MKEVKNMSDKKGNTGIENTGEKNSGDWNSGYGNSGYGNSGYRNSGDGNSGDRNSGYRNSGDGNSGYGNSGDRNSGDWNSGDGNSGYGNSSDRSSGIFCSEGGTVRIFNQDSGKKWDEIDHPGFEEFWLNKWIEGENMTEEEKKADPEFYVRGGYLKTYSWEEAWANFWKDTTEENRQKVLNLPNFDAKIFKEITGIDVDVEEKDDKTKEAMRLLKEKGYRIVKD